MKLVDNISDSQVTRINYLVSTCASVAKINVTEVGHGICVRPTLLATAVYLEYMKRYVNITAILGLVFLHTLK